MSKEFQDEAKRLGINGNQLIQKYIREGKMKNPTDVHYEKRKKFLEDNGFKNGSEYLEHLAKLRGFKNRKEQRRKIYEDDIEENREKNREWHYKNKSSLPMSENENCSSFTGVYLGENIIGRQILIEIFGGIQKEMPYGHRGYEYIAKGGYKIEIKTGALSDNRWRFTIGFNKIADYILVIGLKKEKNDVVHVWLFKKGDIVKKRFGEIYREFKIFNLASFSIGNNIERLSELKDYEITDMLKCIKEINERLNEMNKL